MMSIMTTTTIIIIIDVKKVDQRIKIVKTRFNKNKKANVKKLFYIYDYNNNIQ